jgi:hypothetical protein
MRHRLERLGIRDIDTRALEHAPPALPGSERGQAEITGVLKRVRTAAPHHFARQPGCARAGVSAATITDMLAPSNARM